MKRNVRLEVSNYCNLRCPFCARVDVDKATLNNLHLSLEDVEKFLRRFFLLQVNKVYLSGAVAEPTLNPELIDIVKYLAKYCDVSIDSNGSTRDVDWWAELGAVGVECTFSPDSIKPNNNKYRINSNTDKVIENMRAYAAAGGNAVWKHIPYSHNVDELEDQRNISNEIGAKFVIAKPYPTRNRTESFKDISFTRESYVENSTPHHYCKMLGEMSNLIEISPHGIVYPCCYTFPAIYLVYENYFKSGDTTPRRDIVGDDSITSFIETVVPLIERQGGIESLSLHHHPIHEVLNSPFYKTTLKQSWDDKEHYCNKHCRSSKYLLQEF